MNEPYVPNNSRMAILIISLLTICGLGATALIGPSEKPKLDAIAISTQPAQGTGGICVDSDGNPCDTATSSTQDSATDTSVAADAEGAGASDSDSGDELAAKTADSASGSTTADSDSAGTSAGSVAEDNADGDKANTLGSAVASAVTSAALSQSPRAATSPGAFTSQDAAAGSTDAAATSGADSAGGAGTVGATQRPQPTPTPELAPAVTPETESTDSTSGDSDLETAALPAMAAGTATGKFFTKNEEANGAEVGENTLVVSFEENGSGTFRGVLELDYDNSTIVRLDMSGQLTWTANNPQVDNVLAGTYKRTYTDGRVDSSDEATLKITSLESGSGSLCTTECFGVTFAKD